MRHDGYDGRKHPRTWVFDPADACLSDRRLRTAGDLDLYHICSAAVAGDPVSVVPDLLGGHSDGTYDLLLAGGEEAAVGHSGKELLDGPVDLLLRLVGHIPGIVDGVGHGGGGYSRQLRHIADGHLHGTSSLRNGSLLYANN